MARLEFPGKLEKFTPEWLTKVLHDAGLVREARVVRHTCEVLGEGQGFIGDVIRIRLDYDVDESGAPSSLIAKLPTTTSRKNRGFAQMNGIYEREIRFYQEFAHRIGARTPRHYFSALDQTPGAENAEAVSRFIDKWVPWWLLRILVPIFTWLSAFNLRRYVLLLEDVAPAEVGDQVAGCTHDEARLALQTLARIHAAFWNSSELENTWFISGADAIAHSTQEFYIRGLPRFLATHGEGLSDKTIRQLELLRAHGEALTRQLAGPPFSLTHGDYRLDNLFFDRENGEFIVGDWQTPLRGLPAMDVAYFLGGSLDGDVTSEQEEALLDAYHEELATRGVVDYAREALGADYRRCMLLVLQRMVLMDSDLIEVGGVRGEALMTAWIARTIRRLEHVDNDALVPVA